MHSKRLILGCIALMAGFATVDAHAQELILGYVTQRTGPFASTARTAEIAADMAVDEINAAGGIAGKKLRVVKFDTGGEPEQAVVGIRRLARDEGVLAIIGPYSSSECRVGFPAAERESVVTMAIASSAPNLAANFKFAFRNTMDEASLTSALMKSLQSKALPMRSASIAFVSDDVVSKSFGADVLPQQFKLMNVPVTKSVSFLNSAFDLSPQVAQLMAEPSDIIGVGAPADAVIKLVQELRRQGHKGRVIGGSIFADPKVPQRLGNLADGMLVTQTFWQGLDRQDTRRFAANFLDRVKKAGLPEVLPPSQFDATAYDIVRIYAEALRQTGATGTRENLAKERAAVRDFVGSLKEFPGIVGPISIAPNHDMIKPVFVLEAKNSEWTLFDAVK